MKQQLADYQNHIDPLVSQQILKSALNENIQVLKPIEGIQYSKVLDKYSTQSFQFTKYITESKLNENKFILKINDLVEKLVFIPNTASIFENDMKELAFCLGFTARRPENEVGKGPDVLWRIGELNFFVIECKNGATNEIINKHDCNQLNGSISWFNTQFEENGGSCIPIMIHPGNTFEYASSPDKNIRIITREKLQLLRENVVKFSKSVVLPENFNNHDNITKLLNEYRLDSGKFIEAYTTSFKIKNS